MAHLRTAMAPTLALLALLIPATAQAAELNLPQKASGTTMIDRGLNGVENEYDTLIRLATIGAGAPNATTRWTDAPKVRLVPNAADRLSNSALNWAALRSGGGSLNVTSKDAMPRYMMNTSYEMKKKQQ